jgi:hypothetical protein
MRPAQKRKDDASVYLDSLSKERSNCRGRYLDEQGRRINSTAIKREVSAREQTGRARIASFSTRCGADKAKCTFLSTAIQQIFTNMMQTTKNRGE